MGGIKTPEDANGHIQALDDLFPLGQDADYTFLAIKDAYRLGFVLKVEVQKTREIKRASDGEVYIRRGAQKKKIKTTEDIRRIELDKGLYSFEEETVDLELDTILESQKFQEFLSEIIPKAVPIAWLKKTTIYPRRQAYCRSRSAVLGGTAIYSSKALRLKNVLV